MQSSINVTHGNCRGQDGGRADEPRPVNGSESDIPPLSTEDTPRPPAEKKRVGNVPLRSPTPLLGAACDDDSEAESFRDGRSEEVDRDTRTRAFFWCRDFLSGSWRTLREADFQISIVR